MKLGTGGDAGGTAAATALLLGMGASEIADRIVRDLDGGGLLAVTPAAGVRRLRVPALLQSLLRALARGKGQAIGPCRESMTWLSSGLSGQLTRRDGRWLGYVGEGALPR